MLKHAKESNADAGKLESKAGENYLLIVVQTVQYLAGSCCIGLLVDLVLVLYCPTSRVPQTLHSRLKANEALQA